MNFTTIILKEIVKETSDTYSYIFEMPIGYEYTAGQHALWKMTSHRVDDGDRDTRVFSIASAPEDNFLMFTTRITEKHTSFKEILLNKIKPGDEMMIADPRGEYRIYRDFKNTLMIVGGVGITPIRSLLKNFEVNNDSKHNITLLYSDESGEFAYESTLRGFDSNMSNLDLRFISDRNKFLNNINEYAKENLNNACYLIAGSPGLNKAMSELLTGIGIEKDNIKEDIFVGY